MYTSFYKLRKKPFELNSDPSFLWLGKNHEKAFSILQKGIGHNKGLLLLAGDAGTGKTLLVKAFIQSLGKGAEGAEGVGDVVYAVIEDPRLDRIDFYNAIARGFGLTAVFASKVEFLLQFSHFLHEAARENKKVLLLVDDCHLLSQEMLEELRLLSNIEKAGVKLINIFFVGRPEFDEMLLQQKNRALRQRLTLSAELKSLTIEETDNYIHHRLKIAGTEAPLFVAGAVQAIYRFSQGIPLYINAICDHVLENGSIQGLRTIERKLVEQSIQGMDLPEGLLHENQPDFSREHKHESRFDGSFKAESPQPSFPFGFESLRSVFKTDNRRGWFASNFWLKWSRAFKEFKEGIGFGRLAGLMGLLVLFAMGIMFFFSGPHSQESDLQSTLEIADDLDIQEGNEQAENAAERVENGDAPNVTSVPDVPGVKGDFEAAPPSIASMAKEDEIEIIKEKPVEIKTSPLAGAEGEGEQEIEDLRDEETIVEPTIAESTIADEIDQAGAKPPAEPRGTMKIEPANVKKILDQEEVAGESPMEPRKIILGIRSGSAGLTGDALRTLLNFIEDLEQYPEARLLVKGFVSAKSNTPENIKMSEERALNVQKFMQEKGIDAKRIEVVGMGNKEPIASNDTAEGRSKNRRVEVSIIDDGSESDEENQGR
jgi:type II secretory pathway predicted ATPase ExeA/outer membrane protein OmpA-like peptidoglycan-associated protein